MTDLDLVPTEDLLKALKRRFDHMVFAGIKNMGGGQGEDSARSLTEPQQQRLRVGMRCGLLPD